MKRLRVGFIARAAPACACRRFTRNCWPEELADRWNSIHEPKPTIVRASAVHFALGWSTTLEPINKDWKPTGGHKCLQSSGSGENAQKAICFALARLTRRDRERVRARKARGKSKSATNWSSWSSGSRQLCYGGLNMELHRSNCRTPRDPFLRRPENCIARACQDKNRPRDCLLLAATF